MKKLLSIYIPTYNRYEHIKRQLGVLLRGLQQLPAELQDMVEVVVSDNASTAYGPEQIQPLIDGQKNFVYIRQTTNLGIIKNAYLAVDYCQGEYLWILSDDDFLEEASLGVLMELLRSKDNYNFVFFCHDIYEENSKRPSLYTGSKGAVENVYRDLKETNNFLDNCFQLGLSSALICKYDVYKKVFDVIPEDIGFAHCWGQLIVFYLVKLGHGYIVEDLYLHKNQIEPPSYNDKLKYVFANIYLGCMKYLSLFDCSREDIAYISSCYQDVYENLFLPELFSSDAALRSLAWQVIISFYEEDREAFERILTKRVADGMTVCLSADKFRQTEAYQQELRLCNKAVSRIMEQSQGRELLLWGGGRCGIAMKDALAAAGVAVAGIIDNRFAEQKYFEGIPVADKKTLTVAANFVVIAITSKASREVEQALKEMGFGENDYLSMGQ